MVAIIKSRDLSLNTPLNIGSFLFLSAYDAISSGCLFITEEGTDFSSEIESANLANSLE